MTATGVNVFDDLEFRPEEAANLKIRAHLISDLIDFIRKNDLSQVAAARRLGVKQPRISDLMKGRIGNFTIDALINMYHKAGIQVIVKPVNAAPLRVRYRKTNMRIRSIRKTPQKGIQQP